MSVVPSLNDMWQIGLIFTFDQNLLILAFRPVI